MKWSTTNVKFPDYSGKHELYVGTHIGCFKKLNTACNDNPFLQPNIIELTKASKITALEFSDIERSSILIGRLDGTAQLFCTENGNVHKALKVLTSTPIVGIASLGQDFTVGLSTGQVLFLSGGNAEEQSKNFTAGDDISRMRSCLVQPNLVATGGRGRQNNLKIFDMQIGKQIFSSKNLPNDYLQLEVPVWDSDVGFIDASTLVTCSRYGYVRVYDTRKQRRPVQCYDSNGQLCFSTLISYGNYIYTGTTMGALKAFDIRKMKNFVHTYKGLTGGVSDLHLDGSGKFLASASLDRYVRIHHTDSCVMQYQCYVKSKALRVRIRDYNALQCQTGEDANNLHKDRSIQRTTNDDEYDDMFNNLQTIIEEENDETLRNEGKIKKKTKNWPKSCREKIKT